VDIVGWHMMPNVRLQIDKWVNLLRSVLSRVVIKVIVVLHPALRGYNRINGHLSEYEGLTLYKYSKRLPSRSSIVEVGSFHGRSANYICAGINKENTRLHCIDIWQKTHVPGSREDDEEIFERNTLEFKHLIVPHKGTSRDFAEHFDGTIDLLFVDGDHTYEGVKEDIQQLLPRTKEDAYILFHDYGNPCGVKDAVDEYVERGMLGIARINHSLCVCRILRKS
jgi:predicted O-methyltransferase YrrM